MPTATARKYTGGLGRPKVIRGLEPDYDPDVTERPRLAIVPVKPKGAIKPYNYRGESIRERVASIPRSIATDVFGVNRTMAHRLGEEAAAVADFIPGVGEGIGVEEAVEDWKRGNKVAAIAGGLGTTLGVVPVVGKIAGKVVNKGGKKLAKGLGSEMVDKSPVANVEGPISSVVNTASGEELKGLGALPSSGSLNTPRVPSVEDMAKSRIETVPLSQVRGSQPKMQWERFDKGEFGEPIVKGFSDMPVAVRREDGEYIVFDGHHRAVKAMDEGKNAIPMHVIDAKDYDPANAGRKPVKSDVNDDELLRELGVSRISPKGLGAPAIRTTKKR